MLHWPALTSYQQQAIGHNNKLPQPVISVFPLTLLIFF
jgi:hypothetical protein